MTVDCMACLVAMAKGLPEGGTSVDASGVTHATIRGQYRAFLTCTVSINPNNSSRCLMSNAKMVPQ